MGCDVMRRGGCDVGERGEMNGDRRRRQRQCKEQQHQYQGIGVGVGVGVSIQNTEDEGSKVGGRCGMDEDSERQECQASATGRQYAVRRTQYTIRNTQDGRSSCISISGREVWRRVLHVESGA